MKTPCPKCKDAQYCHYCGKSADARGWERSFTLRDSGPTHVICPSCAE